MSEHDLTGTDKYRVCFDCGSSHVIGTSNPKCAECNSTKIKVIKWEWTTEKEEDEW